MKDSRQHFIQKNYKVRIMSLLPTRVLLLATLAGVCCAHVALAAESKPARADLTAAQILEKHIAARGGLQAWHAVKAMSWSG